MADDTPSLWKPEGEWAEREWRSRFDSERQRLLAQPGALNNTATYGQIAGAGTRLFDEVSSQLLQRVQDILNRCDNIDRIGAPTEIARLVVDPLIRTAKQALPNAKHVAQQRGIQNVAFLEQAIRPHVDSLVAKSSTARQQIQRDAELRRATLEATRTSAAQKSVNERWQRWHHMTNVIRFLGSTVLLAVGYVAGQMDLISRAWTWIKAFFQHSKEMF